MLNNNAEMSNLGQGYSDCWQVESTHTRDVGEKDRKFCRSIPAASFSPVFPLSVAGDLYVSNGVIQWQT